MQQSRSATSVAVAERRLGTLIVARYKGTAPDAPLLKRIRRGEVGGVILFGENTIGGTRATASAVSSLQSAARAAGTYPLLVMTDQEGGAVKRLSASPPDHSPAEMTSTTQARSEGRATGIGLREAGVNVDLAPVADVERSPSSFLGARSFSSNAAVVAARACAFARGLSEAGVIFTLKHFPGLGTASLSTDEGPVSVTTSGTALRAEYGAYRHCATSPRGMVMISSAAYPTLTYSPAPAVTDTEIYRHELRLAGVTVPTISDDLETPALSGTGAPARRALNAGLDLLLYASDEGASEHAYGVLDSDLRSGTLDPQKVVAAAAAVERLKHAIE
jgi:beta-N-acetylhexosaminidase